MNSINTFTAIDFETAQGKRNSICQIGLVRVEQGVIVDRLSLLVKPPQNYYSFYNTQIHGISADTTRHAMTFDRIWPSISPYINRDFGYVENSDGSYTFYTRGVDRLTNMSTSILYEASRAFAGDFPLSEADALWRSFQQKVTKFANDNAGEAVSEPEVTYRPDGATVQQVLLGNLPLSTLSKDCPD